MILRYDFCDAYPYEFEINQAQKIEALAEIIAGYYDKDKIKENRKFIEKLFEDGFMADDDELAEQYREELLEYFEDFAREEYNYGKGVEEVDKYYRYGGIIWKQ